MTYADYSKIRYVIGIDEAGRGPLAGPVSVGVCVIKRGVRMPRFWKYIRDSKKLSLKKREELFRELSRFKETGNFDFTVSLVGEKLVDSLGIVRAVRLGISRSLARLSYSESHSRIFLDGGLRAPSKYVYQETIKGGEERKKIIAAASIVAKVSRDRKMTRLSKIYPEYLFDKHKGYGTKLHYIHIKKHGPAKIHRKTYIGL